MARPLSNIHYSDGFGSLSAAGRPTVKKCVTDIVGELAISCLG